MLRRTYQRRSAGHGPAPQVYPFRKPFYDTPYDEDRHSHNERSMRLQKAPYPAWMDHGYDGTGKSIALYRAHPLSKFPVNLRREISDVPRVFKAIAQGFQHRSGVTLYTGAKLPNPSRHPFITGEPCPVYGWKVLDFNVSRQFDAPQVSIAKQRYKAYVALHERRIIGEDDSSSSSSDISVRREAAAEKKPEDEKPKQEEESKPLLKRLFFWK